MPMILGERLAFVHVPKTGGTFTSMFLQDTGLACWEYLCYAMQGYDHQSHQSLRVLPRGQLEARKVLAGIRDPWSWYVSWFLHASNYPSPAPCRGSELATWTQDLEAEWKECLHAMLWPPGKDRPFRMVVPNHEDRNAGFNWPRVVSQCRQWGCGLLGWLHRVQCCQEDGASLVDGYVRTNELRADLRAVLSGWGLWDDSYQARLDQDVQLNDSAKWDRSEAALKRWYDAESWQWVYDRERAMVDLYEQVSALHEG